MSGEEGLLKSVWKMPATCAVCAANIAVFVLLRARHVPPEDVGLSYRTVVGERQLWRAVTAAFAHYSVLHLAFNVAAVFQLGALERGLGTLAYVRATVLLLLACPALALALHGALLRCGRSNRDTVAVGYSGVAFGLMTIAAARAHGGTYAVLGLRVPALATPFLSLALTQVLVPQASFVGHAAGIAAGLAVARGAFAWFDTWALAEVLGWGAVALVWSLKVSSRIAVPWLVLEPDAPALSGIVVDSV